MAESLDHIKYVRRIVSYMEVTFVSYQMGMMQADLAEYGPVNLYYSLALDLVIRCVG